MGRHSRAGTSKAVHALARRVGKALYYCHLKNEPFDDSGYQALLAESSYPVCPVEEMGLSPGVIRKLKANGLRTSRQVVDAFDSDLGRRPGCGKVTVQAVATWIDSQRDRSRERTRKPEGPEGRGTRRERGAEAPGGGYPEVEAGVEGGPGAGDVPRGVREWFASGGGSHPTRWPLPRVGPGRRSGGRGARVHRQESPGVLATPLRSPDRGILSATSAYSPGNTAQAVGTLLGPSSWPTNREPRCARRSDRPKPFSPIDPGLFQTPFWDPQDPSTCAIARSTSSSTLDSWVGEP